MALYRGSNNVSKLYLGNAEVRKLYLGRVPVWEAGGVAEASPAATTSVSSVSKNGVTFNFDQEYPVGQYANGDYFVVAPNGGEITSATPASEVTSATTTESGVAIPNRVINGMGVNPAVWFNPFDSYDPGTNSKYKSDQNIDPGNTGSAYPFSPGQSIVKAISVDAPKDSARTTVYRLVVLTVVGTVPVAGSFRPPLPGTYKDIPTSWRENQIDWSKVPSLDLDAFSANNVNWSARERNALETWQTWALWGNGSRNVTPQVMPGLYRRELGGEIGACLQALATDASQATKRNVMIGMIQLGIDQIGSLDAYDVYDPPRADASSRWDIGRRAPSVLAALLLPENSWLIDGLAREWRWQDLSSFRTADADIIAFTDDDTQPGMAAGQIGHPEWMGSRPYLQPRVGPSNPYDAIGMTPLFGTKGAAYRKIAFESEVIGTTAIHLFSGAETIYDSKGIVAYNDRWNNLVKAGWPGISEFDRFGNPTGYQSNTTSNSTYNYFRAVRSYMTASEFGNVAPERPEPPTLSENGTQIIVTPTSPYVGHGSAMTQMDVRYHKIVAESPEGSWVEISDVSLDADGRYIISPTPTGGLDANSNYAVGVRYHNAHGPGAWSRNYSFYIPNGGPSDQPWVAGMQTTTTELAASVPSFDTSPVIESYYTEGVPARVLLQGISGLPLPNVTYQWQLNGVDMPGATDSVFVPSAGDANKVLSVAVTVTNSEGSTTETVTGESISVGTGAQTYFPKIYTSEEGHSLIRRVAYDGNSIFSEDSSVRKFTTAAWFFSNVFYFNVTNLRTSVVKNSNGIVQVNLKAGNGVGVGNVQFGPVNPSDLAWYMVSVDTTQANEAERIAVYYRVSGDPYPARRLPVYNEISPVPLNAQVHLARNSYNQRALSPDEDASFADYWHSHGVALRPADFFDAGGNPINIDTIGSPLIRIGGGMTVSDITSRKNNGSGRDPLPAENLETSFEEAGRVVF